MAMSLIIDLLMKTGAFVTDTERASKAFSKMQKQVSADAKKLVSDVSGIAGQFKTSFGSLIGGFGPLTTLLTGGGLVAGVASLVGSLDDLDEAAQNIGTSAVALQEMQAAARLGGVAAEELQSALGKLSVKAVDAASGGKEAAATFAAMGISVKDANGQVKAADVLLGEISDKFASYADGAAKTALAINLFGKAGARMIAFLNQGGAALRANTGLTAETVRQAVELQKQFDELALSAQRFANAIAAAVIPSINAFLSALSSGAGIINAIKVSLKFETGGLTLLQKELDDTRAKLNELRTQPAPVDLFGQGGVLIDTDKEIARLKEYEKALLGVIDVNRKATNIEGGRNLRNLGKEQAPSAAKAGGTVKAEVDEVAKAYQAYVKQLEGAINATIELTNEERVLKDLREGKFGFGKLTEQQTQLLIMMAAEADAQKEINEQKKLTAKFNQDILDKEKQLTEEGKRLTESLRTPQEVFEASVAEAEKLRDAGRITAETFDRAWIKAFNTWMGEIDQVKEKVGELDEFILEAARGIQSELADVLFEGMQGKFENIEQRFKQMLDRMVAEALAAKLAQALFGDFAKTGNVGGVLGDLGKSALGALFGGGSGGFNYNSIPGIDARANGGDMWAGKPYLVGERGPELVVPKAASTVVPNHKLGGDTTIVQVSAVPGMTRQTALQQGGWIADGMRMATARGR